MSKYNKKPELSFGIKLVSTLIVLAIAASVIYGHFIFVQYVLAW